MIFLLLPTLLTFSSCSHIRQKMNGVETKGGGALSCPHVSFVSFYLYKCTNALCLCGSIHWSYSGRALPLGDCWPHVLTNRIDRRKHQSE
uniref:Uncharacterized protein n=1 Tax=Daphnia magna TaxID=35525 RepID=A0A0P6EHE2_9CRUS